MDRSYWLARESASAHLAALAGSVEARLAHLEFARLCRRKGDMEEGEAPTGRRPARVNANPERRWSPHELAVLRSLTANGESIADIAVRMRRTKRAIENQLKAELAMA